MSENEKNERSNNSIIKAVLFMIVLMIGSVVVLCYYPVIKEKLENNIGYQTETLPQGADLPLGGTLEMDVDTFEVLDLEGKEVSVFNYLDTEVYHSDRNYSVVILYKNSGFILRDQDEFLQAAFLGDSWYAMEILPKDPIETVSFSENGELETINGESLNVQK